MYQIRQSMFETNSSSANVLIVPKDQQLHVPKRFIFMDDETSNKPIEKVLYNCIHGYNRNEREEIDKIVNFLYTCGVEEIIYGGKNYYFEQAIEKFKDKPTYLGVPIHWDEQEFKYALFGEESYIEYFYEGDPRPDVDPNTYHYIDEDDENWYKSYSDD